MATAILLSGYMIACAIDYETAQMLSNGLGDEYKWVILFIFMYDLLSLFKD